MGLFGMLGKAYSKLNEFAEELDEDRKRELSPASTSTLESMYMNLETSRSDQQLILEILRERYSSLSDSELDSKLYRAESLPPRQCPPVGLIKDIIVERKVMGEYRGCYLKQAEEWERNYRRNNAELLRERTRR